MSETTVVKGQFGLDQSGGTGKKLKIFYFTEMTSFFEKTAYTARQLENQWMNNTYNSHDLFCRCKDPILHFIAVVNRNSSAPKPEKDVQNIKCLITGTTATTHGEEEDAGFTDGDLEKLFAEDTEDDTG